MLIYLSNVFFFYYRIGTKIDNINPEGKHPLTIVLLDFDKISQKEFIIFFFFW